MGFHGDYTKHRRNIRIGKMGRVKSLGRQGAHKWGWSISVAKDPFGGGNTFWPVPNIHLPSPLWVWGKKHIVNWHVATWLVAEHLSHAPIWSTYFLREPKFLLRTLGKVGIPMEQAGSKPMTRTEPPGGEVNHLTSNPKHLTWNHPLAQHIFPPHLAQCTISPPRTQTDTPGAQETWETQWGLAGPNHNGTSYGNGPPKKKWVRFYPQIHECSIHIWKCELQGGRALTHSCFECPN